MQIILIVLILVLGFCGYFTKVQDGLVFRKPIVAFASHNDDLQFLKNNPKQKACLDYLNLKDSLFTYCKISSNGLKPSVAIIGDSHANAAYYGLSKFLEAHKLGSILLADAGNPLYRSEDFGQMYPYARMLATNQILQILKELKDVKYVYIFARGPLYLTGTEPITGNSIVFPSTTPPMLYLSSIQSFVDELNSSKKEIKLIIENPEFQNLPRVCLSPITHYKNTYCSLKKASVLNRQQQYRELLSKLEGVQVIDVSSVFCNDLDCNMFDMDGSLLYADDDHLSREGSLKLAKYLLSNAFTNR